MGSSSDRSISYMPKGWNSGGGIHCPLIAHFQTISRREGAVKHEFNTVMDILPTVLDLANIEHPGTTFRGRTVVPTSRKIVEEIFKR